jgi:hypothetical protein
LYDNGTKIGVGTTIIAPESRLALGAVDDNEGGQLQFNSGSNNSVAYHLDTYNDAFRIMSGTNTGTTDLRMYLSSVGNIGIGTSAPTGKLDINGKTVTTNLQMTDGATNGYVLQSDALGNGTWVNANTLGALRYVGTSYLGQNSGVGSTGNSEGTNSNLDNIGIGRGALNANTSGKNNIALGLDAMKNNTLGQFNVGVGYATLNANTTGTANLAIGHNAAQRNTIGQYNIALGSWTLNENLIGNNNTILGYSAGFSTLGSGNVMIGHLAGFNETGSDKLYIDNSNTSSPLIWGDFANNYLNFNANVGIGTASPTEKLEVLGKTKTTTFQMTNGAANNYVLTSDASGNASWAASASSSNSNWTLVGSNQFSNISGNVGIGTSSPSTKLHVVGNATLAGTVNFNNNWNVQTGSDFYLEKSGTRYMTVYGTGGNIGIGTNTPTEKLEVAGTLMLSNTTASSDLQFNNATRPTIYPNGTNTPTNLALQVRSKGTGALQLNGENAGNVEIAAGGGNVGIGTTSPNSTVQINGSVAYTIKSISSGSNATSLGASDYMVIYSGSISGNSLSLPTASSCAGRVYMIVNHSTSSVIVTNTYLVANGTASPTITAGSKVQLVSDGSNWHKTN